MPPVHDQPPEPDPKDEKEPYSLPLDKRGGRGRVPYRRLKYTRVVRKIELVDWDLVEAVEKKAEAALSKDGKKPTRQAIAELTYLILRDLKKESESEKGQ